MSLIDDALKQAEKAHEEDQAKTQRVWTPAPLPDRRRIARVRFRNAAGTLLAAAGVLALVLLWLARSRASKSTVSSPASAAVASSSSASGLPPISSEVTVAPPPKGVAESAPEIRSDRAIVRPTRALAIPPPPAHAALRPTAAAPEAPARPQKARESKEASTAIGELTLPGGGKISLDGIVYSENNPVAVLNGQVLAAGGYVEGFHVVSIQPDRVELEGEGRKIFLKLR